ncbi:MAG TPA: dihydrofolate reductase [Verrucomicrobiales bacterium]|nr:dihydrofolate reductase [Verrucomicrobiales bacterium]|tara:strand:+ start:324 stop:812 length:489 start_codon:yes stop_codon:yes gene_type:complete
MTLAAIVAMTPERIIGRDNDLPWHFPEDLKFFKKTTSGHPVVMGRKTFESIGRPLPNRQNIVITRDSSWSAEGVETIHSKEEITELELRSQRVFIMGGAEIYSLFLKDLDELFVSWIYQSHEGDTTFPEFENLFGEFTIVESYPEFEIRLYSRQQTTCQEST